MALHLLRGRSVGEADVIFGERGLRGGRKREELELGAL